MIVDLHAHYPIHLAAEGRRGALEAIRSLRRKSQGKRSFRQKFDAFILDLASRLANYSRWSAGPGVTVEYLRQGGVGVALSVLYEPFDEMDLEHFEGPPEEQYFDNLISQLDAVEDDVRRNFPTMAAVAHSNDEIRRAEEQKKVALVHAVEGGFPLCADVATVGDKVKELSRRGVVYITIAHLFWRDVASNAPALPFLPDVWYRRLFTEPDVGLTPRGIALVEAMAEARVLVDVTHMTEAAMCDTFDLLRPDVPVIASHIACRARGLAYNLTDNAIRKIARRRGVLGVILCDHFCNEGHARTKNLQQSLEAISRQVEQIHSITGSYESIAIGTDLDGFIKPTLAGLEKENTLELVRQGLEMRFGSTVSDQISGGNAMDLLRRSWR